MQIYFYKEILTAAILINGAPVPWEPLNGNCGVLAVDAGTPLALGLIDVANRHVNGVVRLADETAYNEKKNRAKLLPSKPHSVFNEPMRVMPAADAMFQKRPEPPAAAPVEPPPPRAEPSNPITMEQIATAALRPAPTNEAGLRTDGPTLAEWVGKGRDAKDYPEVGYAPVAPKPEESAPAPPADEPKKTSYRPAVKRVNTKKPNVKPSAEPPKQEMEPAPAVA